MSPKKLKNKKVLLCEHKRHTTHRIASTRYAVPVGVTCPLPCPLHPTPLTRSDPRTGGWSRVPPHPLAWSDPRMGGRYPQPGQIPGWGAGQVPPAPSQVRSQDRGGGYPPARSDPRMRGAGTPQPGQIPGREGGQGGYPAHPPARSDPRMGGGYPLPPCGLTHKLKI